MTEFKMHNTNSEIDRLYIHRIEGSRGIIQLENRNGMFSLGL